jgi:ParB family chromosome partitioning protein
MVTKKPKGLGRGLEALLGPQVSDAAPSRDGAGGVHPSAVKLDQLMPGRYQPRTRMDEGSLFELAESIRSQGVMQPVLVRPVPGGDGTPMYEIIAGERRTRAARLAGLTDVPVLVKEVPDQAAAVMALIENIQREDLNPLEEAQGVQRLVAEFGLTHDAAAQAIGRSRSATTNLLRLLNLAEPVQQMLTAGDLDMGHARALLSLDRAHQITCANEIVARQLSVRDAEKLVQRQQGGAEAAARPASAAPEKSRDVQRLEALLSDLLTAPVEIRVKKRTRRGEQGEVAITFASLDELNGLLDRLGATER